MVLVRLKVEQLLSSILKAEAVTISKSLKATLLERTYFYLQFNVEILHLQPQIVKLRPFNRLILLMEGLEAHHSISN